MKTLKWDSGARWDSPNQYWGNPSYVLQPGDPGYIPQPGDEPANPKTKSKKRNYMASNPTPDRYDEVLAAGEDLHDGLVQHGDDLEITQNTAEKTRTDLDALIAAQAQFKQAEGARPTAYAALRSADSNAKGFIAKAVNVLKNYLGNDWSDAWIATGLPDNTVGIPRTQDGRFAGLGGLKAYFTNHPEHENAPLGVTAAIADGLYLALSTARTGVGNAKTQIKSKLLVRDAAMDAFKVRYRKAIEELEPKLGAEDPRWYDFGLNRPGDPATPGVPTGLEATVMGGGAVLVEIDGARRANSFNYYKQVIGVDAEPVKVENTEGTQYTITGLPVGATVAITVTGVNDAGEGQPTAAVEVVVT